MNITLEQRNAQKLFNIINVANLNNNNKDIYFYLKNYVKVMINQLKLNKNDYEVLMGHVNAITNEIVSAHWDIRKFDTSKYDKFLNDFYSKVDFRIIDTDFMFKCKDMLEVSSNRNDLYRRRMEFFDKKLPKILPSNNNSLKQTQNQNNNFNNKNINQTNNANSMPVNPFAGINLQESNPYAFAKNNGPYNNFNQSPYQEINNNNNKNILRAQPPSMKKNNNMNNVNNMNKANNMDNINNFNNMNNMNNMNNINNMNNANNNNNNNNMNNANYMNNVNNMNKINNTDDLNNIYKANTMNNININTNNFNDMNMNMNNMEKKKKIKIPEDLKLKIINELKIVSDDINNDIINCRKHSVEALLLFKQIFPDE